MTQSVNQGACRSEAAARPKVRKTSSANSENVASRPSRPESAASLVDAVDTADVERAIERIIEAAVSLVEDHEAKWTLAVQLRNAFASVDLGGQVAVPANVAPVSRRRIRGNGYPG